MENTSSSHLLPARAIGAENDIVADPKLLTYSSTSLAVGVVLALASTLLIGSSFILKKKALMRVADRGVRAGDGGYAYLHEWLWWAGFLSLAAGEGANFVAYMFAPATLVTPLGGMSVIIGTILSAKFLNERLNIIGKIGCVICLLGATQVVVNAPKEATVDTLDALVVLCFKPSFIVYFVVVSAAVLYLVVYVYPVAGQEHVYIPIGICSLLGSFSVIGIKAVGVGVKATLSGTSEFEFRNVFLPVQLFAHTILFSLFVVFCLYRTTENEFANVEFYFFVVFVIVCVSVQLNYLNRALDVFNTAIVSPIYYVCFTACVLVSSTILFQDWRTLGIIDTLVMFVSFSIISLGVILLSQFRHISTSLEDSAALSWTKAGKFSGRHRLPGKSSSEAHGTSQTLANRNNVNRWNLERGIELNAVPSNGTSENFGGSDRGFADHDGSDSITYDDENHVIASWSAQTNNSNVEQQPLI